MFKIAAIVVVMLNGQTVFERPLDRDDAPFATIEQCNARLLEVQSSDVKKLTALFTPSVESRWGADARLNVTVRCVSLVKESTWDLLSNILRTMNNCGGLAQVGSGRPCPREE